MHKREIIESSSKKYVGIKELQGMLSLGKTKAYEIGKESNAIVKVGRRTLFNVDKILKYMEDKNNDRS